MNPRDAEDTEETKYRYQRSVAGSQSFTIRPESRTPVSVCHSIGVRRQSDTPVFRLISGDQQVAPAFQSARTRRRFWIGTGQQPKRRRRATRGIPHRRSPADTAAVRRIAWFPSETALCRRTPKGGTRYPPDLLIYQGFVLAGIIIRKPWSFASLRFGKPSHLP